LKITSRVAGNTNERRNYLADTCLPR